MTKNPWKEAFLSNNIKYILIAIVVLIGQGVVWYSGQFWALYFLQQVSKVDPFERNRWDNPAYGSMPSIRFRPDWANPPVGNVAQTTPFRQDGASCPQSDERRSMDDPHERVNSPTLISHALAVEAVMRHVARKRIADTIEGMKTVAESIGRKGNPSGTPTA